MSDYLFMAVYIDRNRDMILVAEKECKAGFAVASEPYMNVRNAEWENISGYIVDIINEIAKQPLAEDTKSNVMKAVCKGYKQFTKKHVCINVKYKISGKRYIISNCPRLRNGGYGVYQGTLSEKYSIKYSSPSDRALIQENFLKAYAGALEYLKETGEEL
ncbi:MAG: hypothetical protein K2K70_09105 [Lachnospiraceae bacterium]|nr:hypothetical protein [Lachnospiraceae bacterium]